MKPIVAVQDVSKKFRIQHIAGGYLTLREQLLKYFQSANVKEDFWALNNISFEVNPGESLGIIGRNGAGKSTLLKILSRITPPTKGRITTRGRVASLLEVGTGFHPELTGRENIFFNGSLLGMKRREITTRFDEIVDFSGTEKFLDTPLKHYSSGMQLRLAFSVAAFLEPEILIIDEVLAVGDAEFQKKCLGKMENVTKSGRTILFVSHQLGIVSQLCRKVLLLDKGTLLAEGPPEKIINEYTRLSATSNEYEAMDDDPTKNYQILAVRSLNMDGKKAISFAHDEPIVLETNLICRQEVRNAYLLVAVNNKNGQRIFSNEVLLSDDKVGLKKPVSATLTIPRETLVPGNYSFFVAIHIPNSVGYDVKDQICPFMVYDNGSPFARYENKWFYGDVFVNSSWNFKNP